MNKKLKLGKKTVSLLLSALISFGAFCGIPISAAAEENNVAQGEELTGAALDEIDDYGRNKGIPLPEGMIINETPDHDPNRPDWNGLYKIYYFMAPDEWLDPSIEKYKEPGFDIGFYWFYGGVDDPNTPWPGDPAQNLAEYKIDYYKYMTPNASEEDIAEFTANTEAVFGKVYYALCRSDANDIIWNNGIDGGLPTDENYDKAKAEAAQQTQQSMVQDGMMNVLGSKVEIPDDIYDSDEFFSSGEYEGDYVTGVTDLCGCIAYVRGWKSEENPLLGLTKTNALISWKFYNPISGEMTNKGLTDGSGELILNDLGEAQSPYFDMDYSYIPDEGISVLPPVETNYEIRELSDTTVAITGYNGDETQLDIPEKIGGKKVTEIGTYAFRNCTSLISVTIPESVTKIEESAFEDCTSLISVTIPESVTYIEDEAFYDCPNLKSVTIPASVTYLGYETFGYCSGYWGKNDNNGDGKIDDFTITGYKNSLAYSYAMKNDFEFVSLGEVSPFVYYESYYDEETIEITGYNGYETQLDIPEEIDGKKVTEIGTYAFRNCTSLISVTIPEGVTYIREKAFYDCPNLKSVTIPASVTAVGSMAFGYCYDSKTWDSIKVDGFTITGYKNSVAYKYAMENGFEFVSIGEVSPFIYYDNEDETITITDYNGYDTKLDIPEEIDGKKVTKIGWGAFEGCTSLESVTIPESVTDIGNSAFYKCNSLKSVTIPASVTSIDDEAFGYCGYHYDDNDHLVYEKVDGFAITGYKNSRAYRYARENGFEFVSIGEISPFVYEELDGETIEITGYNGDESQLDIPAEIDKKTVTGIGERAFSGLENITAVTIPASVTSIGDTPFKGCTKLKNIYVSADNDLFYSIDGMLIGKNSYYWELSEFDDSNDGHGGARMQKRGTVLIFYAEGRDDKRVVIPDGVTAIAENAFAGGKFDELKLNEGLRCICENAFNRCKNLKSVICPSTLLVIDSDAFYGCSAISELQLNEYIKLVGFSAFACNTSLETISLPKVFGKIAGDAFYDYYYENDERVKPVIEGYENSRAKEFADNNDYQFVSKGFTYADSIKSENYYYNILEDDTAEITLYTGSDKDLIIPQELDGHSVSKIGAYAFRGCSSIENVTIPDSVTVIDGYAFADCENLSVVTIPVWVEKINLYAFYLPGKFNICYLGSYSEWNEMIGGDSVFDNDIFNPKIYPTIKFLGRASNNKIKWKIDESGTMTVSGQGMINEYGYSIEEAIPWYSERESIKRIVVEEGITGIGNYSFWNCANLKSVSIPKSVEKVSGRAFYRDISLESIDVDGGNEDYKSVGGVLYNNDMSEIIKYPQKKAGSYSLPESVTLIGEDAFRECSELKSLKISERVTSIGYGAFYDCDNLLDIELPPEIDGLYSSGIGLIFAKSGAKRIDGLKISGYMYSEAYKYARENGFEFVSLGEVEPYYTYYADMYGKITLTGYTGEPDNIELPSELDGKTVGGIGANAFTNLKRLSSVNIPESVGFISEGAFLGCTALKSVTIPKNVSSIGNRAFGYYYDKEAKDYIKVDGLTITGYRNSAAYKYAMQNGFKFVSLGEVSPFIYYDNEDETIEIAGYNGYEAQLDIPEEIDGRKVIEIGYSAFYGCTNLASVTIPEGVTGIGVSAFYDCPNLKSVTIPKSVTLINGNAFGYYYDAEAKNIKKLDGFKITGYKNSAAYKYAMQNGFEFTSLGEVSPFIYDVLEDGGLEITDYNGDAARLDIPANIDGSEVTKIGYSAFIDSSSLNSVTVPEGVTEIGALAFYSCQNLKSVTIPASVTEIGSDAFGYYYDMESGEDVKVAGFTIKGYSGTAAEDYAERNDFKFVPLDEIALGDVDKDGKISISDAIIVQKQIVNILHLSDEEIVAADVDKNGQISISDAILIQKHIVSIIDINAM